MALSQSEKDMSESSKEALAGFIAHETANMKTQAEVIADEAAAEIAFDEEFSYQEQEEMKNAY